jgi:hypothetical protein
MKQSKGQSKISKRACLSFRQILDVLAETNNSGQNNFNFFFFFFFDENFSGLSSRGEGQCAAEVDPDGMLHRAVD